MSSSSAALALIELFALDQSECCLLKSAICSSFRVWFMSLLYVHLPPDLADHLYLVAVLITGSSLSLFLPIYSSDINVNERDNRSLGLHSRHSKLRVKLSNLLLSLQYGRDIYSRKCPI